LMTLTAPTAATPEGSISVEPLEEVAGDWWLVSGHEIGITGILAGALLAGCMYLTMWEGDFTTATASFRTGRARYFRT